MEILNDNQQINYRWHITIGCAVVFALVGLGIGWSIDTKHPDDRIADFDDPNFDLSYGRIARRIRDFTGDLQTIHMARRSRRLIGSTTMFFRISVRQIRELDNWPTARIYCVGHRCFSSVADIA